MKINFDLHRWLLRLAVPALFVTLLSMGGNVAMAQKYVHKSIFRVYVGMPTKSFDQDQLASEIRRQLSAGRVSASEKEVQAAARRTLYLIGQAKDPQKGVVQVNFKRFTICVSWGPDARACR